MTRRPHHAAFWPIVQATLFAGSFHNWYRFRNRLLRAFGACIEPTVRIRRTCRIDHPWHLTMDRKSALGDAVWIEAQAPVRIGPRAVVSQHTQIRTSPDGPGDLAPVHLAADAWVATECVVCPGASVPEGVVVGARSVIEKSSALTPWTIATGDPAASRKPRPYLGRTG